MPYSQGRFAASQDRSSARSSCCWGVAVRSIRVPRSAGRGARRASMTHASGSGLAPALYALARWTSTSRTTKKLSDKRPRRCSIRVPGWTGCARRAKGPSGSTGNCGLGWPSRDGPAVELPEASGGLGMGFVEVAVLCEQLGRHLAPVPFAGTVLALGALDRASGLRGTTWWSACRVAMR